MADLVAEALKLVAGQGIQFWFGCLGENEGFTRAGAGRLSGAERTAIENAWRAGMVTVEPPPRPYTRPRTARLTAHGRRWMRARASSAVAPQPGA